MSLMGVRAAVLVDESHDAKLPTVSVTPLATRLDLPQPLPTPLRHKTVSSSTMGMSHTTLHVLPDKLPFNPAGL
jgi:hypothetical protein